MKDRWVFDIKFFWIIKSGRYLYFRFFDKYGMWFHLFKEGDFILFSERYGYKKVYRIGNLKIKFLK